MAEKKIRAFFGALFASLLFVSTNAFAQPAGAAPAPNSSTPAPGQSAPPEKTPAPVTSPSASGGAKSSARRLAEKKDLERSTLPPPAFDWNPKWAKFRPSEYVLVGVQGLAALGALAIPGAERFKANNGFDTASRKVFRATTLSGQREARDVSDALLVVLLNQRLIDDLFVTWWFHDKGSVAFQLSFIDAEALTLSAAVQGLVAGATGRQRPYADTACARPLEKQTANCDGSNRYRSFFSGHASLSFTLAGLTCMHHAFLPLYGNRFADGAACVGSLGAATTVAFMRVVSDQHYMTDVIAGSAVGAAAGFIMPWALHYRGGGTPPTKSERAKPLQIQASVVPAPNGLSIMGTF